jgi:hypothetical protein
VFAAVNAPSCFIQLIGQINMKAPQFSLTAACNEEAARTMHVLGHKARGCVCVAVSEVHSPLVRFLEVCFTYSAMRLNLMRTLHAYHIRRQQRACNGPC